MNETNQVFHTPSRLRWRTFQWVSRIVFFFLVLMIPLVWIALARSKKPDLPYLTSTEQAAHKLARPVQPRAFSRRENTKYRGFNAFLKVKQRNEVLINAAKNKHVTEQRVRAGFLVDWDPQSLFSLQTNISNMNMVIPEWFFIDPVADTLRPVIDTVAYNLMKRYGVKIVPIINNVNTLKSDGDFDGLLLDRVLTNKSKRDRLLNDLVHYLQLYNLQGINVDFEDPRESSIQPLHDFQRQIYDTLHKLGLLVTQNIMPDDEDFHVKELAACNDYLFLMAYDQHWDKSVPGPISDQRWIEKELDEIAKDVPSEKIVLGIAGFGYDWPEGEEGSAVTYQQALSTARQYHAVIDFDNDSYNCHYTYTDEDSVKHTVYFVDAAGNFNVLRFADEYGTAGTALWRLGSEDERIWDFYARDLDNEAINKDPFDFTSLSTIDVSDERPDYLPGDGEVLDVINEPAKGLIDLQTDSTEMLISEEDYQQLPSRYVIKRFGKVNNQVLLTFDDGPDPEYTPRILDILEREKIPAAFFIVGINAENNLPILKRIAREGFEIGNHSFTHPNMALVSDTRAETEMEATRLLIESATGRSTVLFRAPYNADSEPVKAEELKPVARGKEESYYTVGESIDPEDWDTESGINADSIYNRVVRQYEYFKNGGTEKGIILLHDAGGNREATVRALPMIIKYFKDKGVQFTSVANLLNLPKDAIMPPVHGDFLMMDGWVSDFLYWTGNFLFAAFWIAIFLGFGKILVMGIFAWLQYRRSKKEKPLLTGPGQAKVSLIVPAFNEELNAVKTIQNLLQQDYPSFDIIFVDDGSTDDTYEKVKAAFTDHPQVKVFTKPNGGKASSLNYGIERTASQFVVCIDADTQLMPDAIGHLMKYFYSDKVGAVAGNVKVGNEKNILTKWQSIEYTTAQNFDRRAFDYINAITVVPGAIGAFRKSAIEAVGKFTTDTLAEDCDLTIRILRGGYIIRNCTEAIAVTEAPETMKQFMRQRFRWSYGIMQSFWKNRDACFNPRYKALGMVALPNILLFQILMPIIAPIADILFLLSLYWNRHDPESRNTILLCYGIFLLVDVAVSVIAFAFEKEKMYKLVWLIPQRFAYRQLMYVVLFRSIRKAIKGETQGWGVMKRTGNVSLSSSKAKK